MSVQGNKYMFSGAAIITVFSYNAAYVCCGGARDLRQKTGNCPYAVTAGIRFKAIPHNDRLTALHAACLHIFRNLAQILLEIRQYSCVEFMQADIKSDCAIHMQSLCGVALKNRTNKKEIL